MGGKASALLPLQGEHGLGVQALREGAGVLRLYVLYICIYIYIEREREIIEVYIYIERERDRERERERFIPIHTYVHLVYVHI